MFSTSSCLNHHKKLKSTITDHYQLAAMKQKSLKNKRKITKDQSVTCFNKLAINHGERSDEEEEEECAVAKCVIRF